MKTIVKACLLCSTLLVYAEEASALATMGDVNEDYRIDIIDSLLIAQHTVGIKQSLIWQTADGHNTRTAYAADFDCDTKVTILDALRIAQYANGEVEFEPCWSLAAPVSSTTYLANYLGSYSGGRGLNPGVDISVPVGTKVFGMKVGQVVEARNFGAPWNNAVIVRHAILLGSYDSVFAYGVYANLGQILVSKNDPVRADTVLGTSGTGSLGPHVHFQLDRATLDATGEPIDETIPYWPANCTPTNQCVATTAAEQQDVIDHTWDPLLSIQRDGGVVGTPTLP